MLSGFYFISFALKLCPKGFGYVCYAHIHCHQREKPNAYDLKCVFFFLFFMSKARNIFIKKRTHGRQTGMHWVYKRVTPKGKKEEKGSKNKTHQPSTIPTNPHLQPNQVKKSIKDRGLSTMYKYFLDQKLQRKEDFIL